MNRNVGANPNAAIRTVQALLRCPDCHSSLHNLACLPCGTAYSRRDGVPDFLGRGPLAERCREVGAYYDDLYRARTDVWREQGHSDEFTQYIVDLVEAEGPGRYLDIGCGEGFFLKGARRMEGFGVDLSSLALTKAWERSRATVAVAAAERLPFQTGMFDVVTSVGAMEHFLDDLTATAEIRRVLRRGGRYILALLVDVTLVDQVSIKAREFLWPRPRPILLARWLLRKTRAGVASHAQPALPRQPVQNHYQARHVRALFRRSGFRQAWMISKLTSPQAPLPGHYMRLYGLEAI